MKIAIDASALTDAETNPRVLQLSAQLSLWHAAGEELILIHRPEAAGEIPAHAQSLLLRSQIGPWKLLALEAWELPRRAAQAGAEALYCPDSRAPLSSPIPVVVALSARHQRVSSVTGRIRRAVGQAGLRGAAALLWPSDLPRSSRVHPATRAMPPFVGPGFAPAVASTDAEQRARHGLKVGYSLAFCTTDDELRILLGAWSWVAAAVGDDYPLVILGRGDWSDKKRAIETNAGKTSGGLRYLDGVSLEELAALYRGADVFLHAGMTDTGQELRWALACGLPLAGMETPAVASVVGEAGYLVPPPDTRALGAACLSLIVEPALSETLKQKGLERAMVYHAPGSRRAWAEVFRSVRQAAA